MFFLAHFNAQNFKVQREHNWENSSTAAVETKELRRIFLTEIITHK